MVFQIENKSTNKGKEMCLSTRTRYLQLHLRGICSCICSYVKHFEISKSVHVNGLKVIMVYSEVF